MQHERSDQTNQSFHCCLEMTWNLAGLPLLPSLPMKVMLQVIQKCHPGSFPVERNSISDGSTRGKRLDCVLGQPPLVLVEEKASGTISVPQAEIKEKSAWIPHYGNVDFLIGIAITRSQIRFFKHTVQGPLDGLTIELANVRDRMK